MPLPTTTRPKRFGCTYDGCGKRFTRSDHLQRHYLNHKGGDNTCPRCNLHFKRPDLLERHLIRHQDKDEEAGGEGLGDLQTRKKLWRDSDGRIVTKRPTKDGDHQQVRKKQSNTPEENCLTQDDSYFPQDPYPDFNSALLSPPGTLLSTDSMDQFSQVSPDAPIIEQPFVSQDDIFDFLANSTWGDLPSSAVDMQMDAPLDDMFRPDTASSFNMPFTTMNNYNWLFETTNDLVVDTVHKSHPVEISSNAILKGQVGFAGKAERQVVVNHFSQLENFPEFEIPKSNGEMSWNPISPDPTIYHQNMPGGQVPARPGEPPTPQTRISRNHDSARRQDSHPSLSNEAHILSNSSIVTATRSVSSVAQSSLKPAAPVQENLSRTAFNSCKPLSPASNIMPTIDDDSRGRILDLLIAARPLMPAGIDVRADNPLLSLFSMQTCLNLFFSRFNVVYPLLHKPTFDPATTETFLLLAVILLGATYSDKEMHMLAVCIHDTLRAQIFSHPEFTATPELWILQTMLLVECFGKSRAGQKQHDMSHLFHGLLINLIRRSDCQTVRQPYIEDVPQNVHTMWRKSIDAELRKRLAFLCFIWDTQHAVLFSQSLCMSSFELRTALPCNESTWEANSADEWYECAKTESQIPYLSILRAYVNPGSGTTMPSLNTLSRLLILHGLMSIQWDMKRRDQASLGYGPTQVKWDERLAQCYDTWKADFDDHSMNMMLSLNDNPSRRAEFTRFSTATVAIYHASYITLNVEILDLQIYAGARHIVGRPVFPEDFNRSRRVLKEWARPGDSTPATKAVWHAAQLLKDGIMKLENWDVDSAFHYPWCLYLASLTCWAFHFANVFDVSPVAVARGPTHQGDVANTPNFEEKDVDLRTSKAEMIALVSHLATAMPGMLWQVLDKRSTSGLTMVMASHLGNIRWSVVHEAMKVLRGLAI